MHHLEAFLAARARSFPAETLGLAIVPELSDTNFVALRAAGNTLLTLEQAQGGTLVATDPWHFVEFSFQVPAVDSAWQGWHPRGVQMVTEPSDTPFGTIFGA